MATENPFKIAVPDASIDLLKQKLSLATLPDELDEVGWEYGAPLADVRRLVARWRDGYDWRKYETQINNELPQFTRDIDVDGFGTLNIHYVHKRSSVESAIPLLFVHGWPGNFLEVRKILPLLVDGSPDHPSFHVVTFSLPGYGFSDAPKKRGFALNQFAEVGNKLMLALGYNEYVTQGGDWGHMITQRIATEYGPKHSKGMHSNFPLGFIPHPTKAPLLLLSHLLFKYSKEEQEGLDRSEWYLKKGSGYVAEQSTQPQTLGYGLADSPVGLLAWIYEKLVLWTDNYPWEDDEVLTWISIYWFSRAGPAASLRIYYEVPIESPEIFTQSKDQTSAIPMGYSFFPKEIVRLPRKWVKTRNLVFQSELHERGGHFAAHEVPELIVGDVRKMFGKGGPAFGVVPVHHVNFSGHLRWLFEYCDFHAGDANSAIDLLRQRLALTGWPDELEDAGWDYGSPLADIKRLAARWADGYDWRKHEAQLNADLPQFTRDIDIDGFGTLNIHYVHKKSTISGAIPLLFVHGWPGSFIEVRKILPLLIESSPEHPSFHVVAFSLPGFGFSEAPKKRGFGVQQFAEVGNKLMIALGYNEYVTQGGDWGHIITHKIAQDYGEKHSKAMHSNFPLGVAPTPAIDVSTYSQADQEALARRDWYFNKGSGYAAEQSTQPQTLGYGIAGSPTGLLAWIYEKLVQWTDSYPWDDDEGKQLLTWVSIYYFSRAGPAASLRIYLEVKNVLQEIFVATKDQSSKIPLGYSYFPKEILRFPRSWIVDTTPNLVFESKLHDRGGHFASYETPELLVEDLRCMFGKGGPAFGVISGKTGFVVGH